MSKYRMRERPVVDAFQFTGDVEAFNAAIDSSRFHLKRSWAPHLWHVWFREGALAGTLQLTDWLVVMPEQIYVSTDADFRAEFEEVRP